MFILRGYTGRSLEFRYLRYINIVSHSAYCTRIILRWELIKENKKVRKQEKKNSTKKATK